MLKVGSTIAMLIYTLIQRRLRRRQSIFPILSILAESHRISASGSTSRNNNLFSGNGAAGGDIAGGGISGAGAARDRLGLNMRRMTMPMTRRRSRKRILRLVVLF
jgi:hypothetical protein